LILQGKNALDAKFVDYMVFDRQPVELVVKMASHDPEIRDQ